MKEKKKTRSDDQEVTMKFGWATISIIGIAPLVLKRVFVNSRDGASK